MHFPAPGTVFRLEEKNQPVPGCTVSECLWESGSAYVSCFSLAAKTDISAEIYPYYKLILVSCGKARVIIGSEQIAIRAGEAILTPMQIPTGMIAEASTVYTEIVPDTTRRNEIMNDQIKPGEVFQLAGLLPVQEGKIVNMDVTHNDKMKLALMSFAAGTGLTDHAAPGNALIFALEGEGIIRYEGTEHIIHAGENFAFAKGGMHAVRAEKPFKMALLLTFD